MTKKIQVAPPARRVVPAAPLPPMQEAPVLEAKAEATTPTTPTVVQSPNGESTKKPTKRVGRPKKSTDDKAVPVNLTMTPQLNAKVDEFLAELNTLSLVDVPKSQLVSLALTELINRGASAAFDALLETRRTQRDNSPQG